MVGRVVVAPRNVVWRGDDREVEEEVPTRASAYEVGPVWGLAQVGVDDAGRKKKGRHEQLSIRAEQSSLGVTPFLAKGNE